MHGPLPLSSAIAVSSAPDERIDDQATGWGPANAAAKSCGKELAALLAFLPVARPRPRCLRGRSRCAALRTHAGEHEKPVAAPALERSACQSAGAMSGMLGVFAEFEREIRRERVMAGIADARARAAATLRGTSDAYGDLLEAAHEVSEKGTQLARSLEKQSDKRNGS
jgi:hypothetical protein